jgi:cell division protein FtsL
MSAPAQIARRPKPQPTDRSDGAPDGRRSGVPSRSSSAAARRAVALQAPVRAPARVRRAASASAPAEPATRRREPTSAPARVGQARVRQARVRQARATSRRHRAGFVVLLCAVVGCTVLGLVSMNALLANTSFRVDDLSRRIDSLETHHLELVLEQAQLSAPGRIAEWARRIGMRLPDDIRILHAPDASTAPAEGADAAGVGG